MRYINVASFLDSEKQTPRDFGDMIKIMQLEAKVILEQQFCKFKPIFFFLL